MPLHRYLTAVLGFAQNSTSSSSGGNMMGAGSKDQSSGTMMKSNDAMSGSSGMMMASPEEIAMSADPMDKTLYNLKGLGSQIRAFTTEKDAWALAAKGTVVYFFAATWCPDCETTYHDIKARFATIPSNFTIIFVNYDKAADLKRKYGITVQHSFVVIGPKGEVKKVFVGTNTVADIVKAAMN